MGDVVPFRRAKFGGFLDKIVEQAEAETETRRELVRFAKQGEPKLPDNVA